MARIQARRGKRRTTYSATVRVKGYPTITRTFDTKGEARKWAADIEAEMRAGRYQDTRPIENVLFVDVLDKYLEQISTNKRPNSERRDRDSAKAILNGLGEDIFLTEVNTQRLACQSAFNIDPLSASKNDPPKVKKYYQLTA